MAASLVLSNTEDLVRDLPIVPKLFFMIPISVYILNAEKL